MKLLLAILIFTISSQSAQPEHSEIPQEKGEFVHLVILDAARHPIAGAQIELSEIVNCVTVPCPPAIVTWAQKSGTDGSLMIPRKFVHDDTLVGTRGYEPSVIRSARWAKDGEGRVIRLLGQVATVCSKIGSRWTIRVANDWRSAQVNSGEAGDKALMQCVEGKGIFLNCIGPRSPDSGFWANFTRSDDSISARLIGDSVRGRRELAQLDCFPLGSAEPIPRDLKEWTLEYSLTGGNKVVMHCLQLKQTGELEVWSGWEGANHVTSYASPEVMAKFTDFLKVAQKAKPAHIPGPDERVRSLALISGRSKYELMVPEDIGKLLEDTWNTTLK